MAELAIPLEHQLGPVELLGSSRPWHYKAQLEEPTAPPVTVTQSPATETLIAGLSNTVISTVTLQSSAGGSAKVSVITLTPGQSTTIPGIITVAGSAATGTAGASSSSSGSKLGVGAIAEALPWEAPS